MTRYTLKKNIEKKKKENITSSFIEEVKKKTIYAVKSYYFERSRCQLEEFSRVMVKNTFTHKGRVYLKSLYMIRRLLLKLK